jgi:hypothetical protein
VVAASDLAPEREAQSMTPVFYPRKLKLVERLQISRCLNGHQLTCGCLVGRYLTHGGQVLTVVDADADECRDRGHQVGFVIGDTVAGPATQPAS